MDQALLYTSPVQVCHQDEGGLQVSGHAPGVSVDEVEALQHVENQVGRPAHQEDDDDNSQHPDYLCSVTRKFSFRYLHMSLQSTGFHWRIEQSIDGSLNKVANS